VQAEVERALATLHKAPRRVTAAGRTDAGVHARGQVVSFPEERPLPLAAYVKGMNALLPDDVAVRSAALLPDGFDARRSARGKRYRYTIENLETRAPLGRLQAWQLFGPLDVAAMHAAAQHLVGRHDFAAFQAADCASEHAVRDVFRLDVLGEAGGRIEVVVEATAFVKHMVRNFVGTLVEVGQGKREAASIPALVASRDRKQAGRTAPPHGLCLEEVFY
ncbi:MAG TPA: tRNA pseudouridine(38-40) synthase TruA, partial [Anaeromyxobacter sp.]|nr:tRNA pseudouridine(38-40) synthase TruA [Anaeromyxobacter sp.]